MLCMQDNAVFIDHRSHSFSEFCCFKRQSIFPLHHNKTEAPLTSNIMRLLVFFFFTSVLLTAVIKENPHFFVFDNFQFALWNGQSKYTWFLWQINMLTWSSLSQRWQFRELASLKQYVLWQLIWVFEKFFLIIFMLLVASLYSRSNKD